MSPKLPPSFLRVPLAHRALHHVHNGRPENSLSAIRAAIDAGYGIEIDVQASADKQAMVFHDYDLARLAHASGDIRERSEKDLQRVTLRGSDESIPTLSEVLAVVAGQVPLLVEIKDQDGALGPNVGPLERSVAQALSGYQGPIAVMSFNPDSIKQMKALAPHLPRGLVTESFQSEEWGIPADVRNDLLGISEFEAAGCSFISHDHTDLNRDRVLELKSKSANILCWTITNEAEEARARKIAENITFEKYLPTLPA